MFVEANLLYGNVVNVPGKIPIMYYSGFRIAIESNLSTDHYTIAPKIGYEYTPELLSFRLSAVNYFQDNNSEFRILPEIGLSLFTLINLNYGYGISFNDQNLHNVGKHRISITINLNRTLNRAW